MTHDAGRPLDPRERDEFAAILAGYRRTARRADGTPAARTVVSVLGAVVVVAVVVVAVVVVAVVLALLPAPLNLWAPVGVLAVVALGAVGWGIVEKSRR